MKWGAGGKTVTRGVQQTGKRADRGGEGFVSLTEAGVVAKIFEESWGKTSMGGGSGP